MIPRILLLWLATAFAPGDAPPTDDEIRARVSDLGSPRLETRVAASDWLLRAGPRAEPFLKQATEGNDLEVVFRARQLLERIQDGFGPDTSAEVIRAVERFRFGDRTAKIQAIDELLKRQEIERLRKLVEGDSDATLREELNRRLLADSERLIPQLIAAGKYDEAEASLEAAWERGGSRHLAAWLDLRGKAPARLATLRQDAQPDLQRPAGQLLWALLRLAGEHDEVQKLAERSGNRELVATSLLDRHDWAGWNRYLHQQPPGANADLASRIRHWVALAMTDDFSGNRAAIDQLVQKIEDLAGDIGEQELDRALGTCANLLQLVGRPDAAIGLLGTRRRSAAFEIHRYQGRYLEAFRTVAILDPLQPVVPWFERLDPDDPELAVARPAHPLHSGKLVAQSLYALGERDEAERLFTRMFEVRPQEGAERYVKRTVAQAEWEAGLDQLALDHGQQSLALEEDPRPGLASLLGRQSAAAATWWQVLRALDPESPQVDSLRTVRALLQPLWHKQLSDDAWETLSGRVQEWALAQEDKLLAGEVLVQMAEVERRRDRRERALELLTLAMERHPQRAAQPLGQLQGLDKQFDAAAATFARLVALDPVQPLPWYLQGYWLVRAGREEEGKRLIERARLLPLGDINKRQALAQGLKELALFDEAIGEWELIVRLAGGSDWPSYLAGQELAFRLGGSDEFRAAQLWQRLSLRLAVQPASVERDGWLRVRQNIHRLRASALLRNGEQGAPLFDELRAAQSMVPHDVQFPIDFVPRLEEVGLNGAADEIFDLAFRVNDDTLRTFPRSALHANNLAWMAAKCRRRLDEALTLAERAVKLSPDSAGYLDTLAEVHFQRGNRDEALKLAQRCVELEPRNPTFQRQVERFSRETP